MIRSVQSLRGSSAIASAGLPKRTLFSFAPQAASLKAGDKLADYPEFYRKLKTDKGDMVSIFDITQRAKKGLVLFFYPKAATPGCTKEACSFRDQYQVFQDAGAEVVGISGDGVEAQKSFASGNRLPFPLLSDTGDIVRKGFGIPNDMFGLLPGRQTYVISKDGKCVLAFNDALNFEAHVKSALDAVKVLQ